MNGFGDLAYATASIYRTGVGVLCAADDANCYQLASPSCTFSNCSGVSCALTCSADVQYFADPTDIGTFSADTWKARVSVFDNAALTSSSTSAGVELLTLRAISVTPLINYGTLSVGSDTGSNDATSTVTNSGNSSNDLELSGTDLTAGGSTIAVTNQKYASTTFTYSSCAYCAALSTSPTSYEADLPKPTSTASVSDDLFWGLFVPVGTGGVPHQGENIFMAISD